jgi:protocatechuate 3,4-dioxygenase beta subunit
MPFHRFRRRVLGAHLCFLLLVLASTARAATLGGRVVGPNAEGVGGAQIFMREKSTTPTDGEGPAWREVKADATGRFAFEMPDEAKIAALDTGGFYGVVFAPGFAVRSTILSGTDNTLALEKGARITGTVKNDQGAPLEGVVVRLWAVHSADDGRGNLSSVVWHKKSPLWELFSATSRADGSFEIANLPADATGHVQVDDPRFVNRYTQTKVGGEAALVAVRGATLKGRVVSPVKTPLAGLKINIMPQGRGDSMGRLTQSGADGSFTVTGLEPDKVRIRVSDPKGEWAGAATTATLQAGQEQTVPALEVQKGVLVRGSVVDDANGAPLSGALMMFSGEMASSSSRATGADGQFEVHLLPGNYSHFLSRVPAGYVRPENSERMVLKETAPAPLTLRLKRGVALSGIARDETGKAVAGAVLQLGEMWRGEPIRTDAQGNWKSSALRFGPTPLTGAGEWDVVSPKSLTVPALGAPNPPLEIKLRRVVLGEVSGRAVTPEGVPIAGVAVELRLFLDAERNSRSNRRAVTDAQGRFSLPKIRPEQSLELVSAAKAGFAMISAGQIKREGNNWAAGDIVLSALDGRVSGRIRDEAGAPLAGAKVMALGRAPFEWALSRPDGSFELLNLPQGKITLLAAQGTRFGRLETTAGQTVEMQLAAPPASDAEKLWTMAGAAQGDGRGEVPVKIAPFEPERAWAWASGGENAGIKSVRRAAVIEALAQRDPQRAVQWAPEKLAEVEGEAPRFRAGIALARAALSAQPPATQWAQTWIAEQSAALARLDFSREAADKLFALAGLAARLGQKGKASEFLERGRIAMVHSDKGDGNDYNDPADAWAKSVAFGGAALLEEFAQGERETLQLRFLTTGAALAAGGDATSARRLHARIGELAASAPVLQMDTDAAKAQEEQQAWRPSSRWLIDRALPALAVSVAPQDAKLARTLLGEMGESWQRPTALAALGHKLARAEKREEAIAALREAAKGTSYNPDEAARIAWLAGRSDPELGRELKQKLVDGVQKPDERFLDFQGGSSVAPYVFYFGSEDAAAGRLLLEAEWEKRQAAPKTTARGDEYQITAAKARLARAMASLDPMRALEMAQSLGNEGQSSRVRAQIIADALLPADERRLSSLADFGEYDELFR